MNLVALAQQKLRQIRPVLSGDPGDQRNAIGHGAIPSGKKDKKIILSYEIFPRKENIAPDFAADCPSRRR
jgi:hypothetical protein